MLEREFEIAGNQRADFLRLRIIGVIETGRQHVGADQDAALDLWPEPGGAGRGVHVLQVRAVRQIAQAIPHPVITGEVGRGFGRGDDVIRGQRILGVRQADLDDLGPGVLQPGDPVVPAFGDIGIKAIDAVFLGNADLLALHIGVQARFPIGNRHVEAG